MGPRTRNTSRNSILPPPDATAGSQSSRASTVSSQGPSPRYSAPPSADHEHQPPSDSKNLAAITEREYDSASTPGTNSPPPPPPLSPPTSPDVEVPDEPLNVTSVPKVAGLTPPASNQVRFCASEVERPPAGGSIMWLIQFFSSLYSDSTKSGTFNSKELQALVSTAIRGSSRESFIRVLSMENLEQTLPAELERLNILKTVTQSKYRFTVHRRTMLLQALHSFSGYNDKEGAALVAKLTSQLSQTTVECDQLLEELLQIADQVGQINHLLDQHWSSALAIALRKLNSSYGRRTSELLTARAKISTLEAELNDAWQQAEKLAKEMDDMDAAASDEELAEEDLGEATLDMGDAVIEVAEVISLNHRKSPSASSRVISLNSLNHRKSPSGASSHASILARPMEDTLSLDAISRMHSEQSQMSTWTQDTTPSSPSLLKLPTPTPSEAEFLLGTISGPTVDSLLQTPAATALETEYLLRTPSMSGPTVESLLQTPALEPLILGLPASTSSMDPSPQTETDTTDDAVSIRSARSVRSTRSGKSAKSARTARSQRTTDVSRVSSVSAARRRSQRTSMSSLRMPPIKAQMRKGSHPPPLPVPTLPLPTSPATERRTSTIESFLDFAPSDSDENDIDNDDATEEAQVTNVVPVSPRRTSIDDIEVVTRSPATIVTSYLGTRDDITVMPSRSATEAELVAPRRSQFSLDHQHPFANEESVTQSIPSIWLLQDTPKTPAERVESMMRDRNMNNVKMGSFQRLKSLTKRYSLPFPGVVARTKVAQRNATAAT
ncbi:hypothetical protein MSAN_00733600 [Mycena sanguinolenta]|uniref:Uncharacterized protein n=1 Tax=Mycena sanguinolenta TaxID=230812 RepID=A0A8H6Z4V4_9AGAR|nr:hypothetical protein MSAN_00733600 [Mycena sanguinolenta]